MLGFGAFHPDGLLGIHNPVCGSLVTVKWSNWFVVIVFLDEIGELSTGDIESSAILCDIAVVGIRVPATDFAIGDDIWYA